MSRLTTHRSALAPLVAGAVIVIAALLVAGFQTTQVRTYALHVPDSGTAGIARPGHRLCEGPIQSPARATAVGVFVDPASGDPVVEASVLAGRRQIATGHRIPDPRVREQLVTLDHPIPAGRAVEICVRALGGTLTVWGAGAQTPGVIARGVAPGTQFALVLTRPGTLLGTLSTAFSRAAIFRPSWVGAWTFWLLVGLLACTLPLAGVAVLRALPDPEPDENSHARNGSS